MGTLINLTLNHVRARFRKLPVNKIRVEHLLTSARVKVGRTTDVYISEMLLTDAVGSAIGPATEPAEIETSALKLDGKLCDRTAAAAAAEVRAIAFKERKEGETLRFASERTKRRLDAALRGE